MAETPETQQLKFRVSRLAAALDTAPRPTPNVDAEWMVQYMDWFFQMRINAIEDRH